MNWTHLMYVPVLSFFSESLLEQSRYYFKFKAVVSTDPVSDQTNTAEIFGFKVTSIGMFKQFKLYQSNIKERNGQCCKNYVSCPSRQWFAVFVQCSWGSELTWDSPCVHTVQVYLYSIVFYSAGDMFRLSAFWLCEQVAYTFPTVNIAEGNKLRHRKRAGGHGFEAG